MVKKTLFNSNSKFLIKRKQAGKYVLFHQPQGRIYRYLQSNLLCGKCVRKRLK